jgi:hypothetical protein
MARMRNISQFNLLSCKLFEIIFNLCVASEKRSFSFSTSKIFNIRYSNINFGKKKFKQYKTSGRNIP